MTTTSTVLLSAGALVLLLAIVVPGWDTATLSRRSVKRRLYWTGTGVGMVLLLLGALPDLQSAVAFVAAAAERYEVEVELAAFAQYAASKPDDAHVATSLLMKLCDLIEAQAVGVRREPAHAHRRA